MPVCSMYGTTEIGVVLVNYPGAPDFVVKPGSLGKPVPGVTRARCRTPTARPAAPGVDGELMLWRRDGWVADQGPRPRSTRTATSITAVAPTT